MAGRQPASCVKRFIGGGVNKGWVNAVSRMARLSLGACCLLMAGSAVVSVVSLTIHNIRRILKDKECEDGQTVMIELPKPSKYPSNDDDEGTAGRNHQKLFIHVMPLRLEACSTRLSEIMEMIALDSDGRVGNSPLPSDDAAAFFGLDCEWEPESNSSSGPHRISVIQLSSLKHCMIFRPLHTTANNSEEKGGSQKPSGQGTASSIVICGNRDMPAASLEQVEILRVPPSSRAPPAYSHESSSGDGMVPLKLRELLEDPRVIKAGVGIQEDVRRLNRDFGINVKVVHGPESSSFNQIFSKAEINIHSDVCMLNPGLEMADLYSTHLGVGSHRFDPLYLCLPSMILPGRGHSSSVLLSRSWPHTAFRAMRLEAAGYSLWPCPCLALIPINACSAATGTTSI